MKKFKSGFLLGKFMPFHKGHQYLIETASEQCEHLTVLVCSTPQEPIPGWLRYAWVKNTFPALDVRHVTDLNPQEPGEHRFFWEIWRDTIRRNTPPGIEVVFSSENYGDELARWLGIRHVLVDRSRQTVPISATMIRRNPLEHWDFIPAEVRPYYIRRVALLGPESSGKSYMSAYLARHFQTAFVEEYGRTYTERFGIQLNELDFAHIAGGQLYREDEMARRANRILFCDTDLIVTQVWSEIFFEGRCQPWIIGAAHARRYDLFLLLRPDIDWEDDGTRAFEGIRAAHFERLRNELESRNLPYVVIEGDYETRAAMSVRAVEAMLSAKEG